jgi:crotonobetainyl-CoA:carnitine CoA-transferase CaiB-like acyl-CoA transferase
MPDMKVQFQSSDGCIYVFIQTEKRWYKFCPVSGLPLDVKEQVYELKAKADALNDAV